MIEYIKKDVTEVTDGVILHGCNAQGVMGSGVAKAIRDKWPGVFDVYKEQCDSFSDKREQLLGDYTAYIAEPSVLVINGITQLNYGKDGKRYADPVAIGQVFEEVYNIAGDLKYLGFSEPHVYLPRIGCGLGGLNWETDVLPQLTRVIEEGVAKHPVTFYVCDL